MALGPARLSSQFRNGGLIVGALDPPAHVDDRRESPDWSPAPDLADIAGMLGTQP